MSDTQPIPRRRWLRITLQVLLALVTATLIYFIILPALQMPKR
jgi:hypothetical protein